MFSALRAFEDFLLGGAPEPAGRPASGCRDGEPVVGFTELSPALLAMEAERLGLPAAIANPELLRRQLYLQLKQQAPVPGPAPATDV